MPASTLDPLAKSGDLAIKPHATLECRRNTGLHLPIIVTLSSIPPRFHHLPEFFSVLGKQRSKPHKVELNLARNYRRFPGELPALPALPDWVDVHWVETDLGPATKILPTCERYRGQNVGLLFCDDDQSYGPAWVESFETLPREVDAEIFCGMGFDVSTRYGLGSPPKQLPRARAFSFNAVSLLVHVYNDVRSLLEADKKNREWRQTSRPGYVDVFEGFRGVLINPDVFPEETWNIPDAFFVADDIWLSGQAARNRARAWMLDMPMNRQRIDAPGKIAPLYGLVHQGMDRDQVYAACIRHFQSTYGVWTEGFRAGV